MGMKMGIISFGSKGISFAPNQLVDTRFCLILGSLFGFLSFLRALFLPRNNQYEGFGFLGFLHYDLFFMLSSLLILGLWVRRLSRRCDQFQRSFSLIRAKLTRIRNGLCWNGGSCACFGSKMQSLKIKGSETERELRRKLRRERRKRKEAMVELEREREASAWASEEAMAKIMLLQSEKALVEREARQYRQMMEKKQLYDEDVIDYLQQLVGQSTISMERTQRGE